MTEENLNNILANSDKEYEGIVAHNEKMKKIERLLKESDDVKSLFDLSGIEKPKVTFKDEDFQKLDYSNFLRELRNIDPNNTNKIFIYVGSYMSRHAAGCRFNSVSVNYNDPRCEFRIYHDIESSNPITLHIDKCREFERNNHVLFISYSDMEKVRREFISLITSFGFSQEEATDMIVKTYVLKP